MFSGSFQWFRATDWQKELADVFSIDLRSLALVRIGTAAILLGDLVLRFPYIRMFYGDGGILPSSEIHTFWMGNWAWSIHDLFGGPPLFVGALFVVHILFAAALTLGYRTRWASIGAWFLLVSLHNTNPLVLLGGDFLLRAVLFVGMFLPWGEFFSLDARRVGAPQEVRTLSPWSAAFLIQLALIYYFASLFKTGIEWSGTGNALYEIASIDQYATPLSKFIVHFPALLKLVTFGVTYFQHLVVPLLFFPLWNRYIRTITALLLICMHLTFGLSSYLGIFSLIEIAALIAFIPTLVWDEMEWFLAPIRTKYAQALRRVIHFTPGARGLAMPVWLAVLGVIYISYLFLWQASDFAPVTNIPGWNNMTVAAKVLRIDQRWNLFAPRPYTEDGWDIIEGHLAGGDVVDLFRDGAPISYEKPEDVYAIYQRSFIRQYTLEFRRSDEAQRRKYWGRYLCTEWNSTHAGTAHLDSMNFIFMLEPVVPPGVPQPAVTKQINLTWSCV